MAFCSLGEAAPLMVLLQLLFSSVLGQYNFTLPMQDWISSVSLTHCCNFSPMFVCYSQFLPFSQSPTEKLQLPTCSLPLQHPPGVCPLQITKPINPHTHFLIYRLARFPLFPSNSARITSPPAQYLLHTAFISILQLHISTMSVHSQSAIFSMFPLSSTSPASFPLAFQPDKEQGCPECWGMCPPWQALSAWPRDTHPSQGLSAGAQPALHHNVPASKCCSGRHLLPLHISSVQACDHNRYAWLKIANGSKSYERPDINRK